MFINGNLDKVKDFMSRSQITLLWREYRSQENKPNNKYGKWRHIGRLHYEGTLHWNSLSVSIASATPWKHFAKTLNKDVLKSTNEFHKFSHLHDKCYAVNKVQWYWININTQISPPIPHTSVIIINQYRQPHVILNILMD